MLEQKENLNKEVLFEESNFIKQKTLNTIIGMTERIAKIDGNTKTIVPFFSVTRHSHEIPITPGVMNPAFSIILQGRKEFHFGDETIHFNAGDFAASIIDMPVSVQVIGASKELPCISLRIDFTTSEIASVILDAKIEFNIKNKNLYLGAFVGKSDEELLDLFIRLLKLINKSKDTYFLSQLIKREMIYHLLSGEYGYLFFQQVLAEQQADGIGKAIEWIKENYKRSFTVEELAKSNNMSVSGLHHKFKAVTAIGPLQYQKELRLHEARRLMFSDSIDVTTAAMEVGYESSSQFTREYKRLFGQPPLKHIRALRKSFENGEFQSGI
ncbi:AraC family transcriptional regulator [Clostridium beijerinckii]|uniref:AraC family transcriptional regulator n=3 Tax=Clostridium TaxID=1485 RepID=A0AAV3VXZ8_9CLOT|nr:MULTISPECIES: AraC family transcriptional regulator [Clostridium]AVK47226.1 AraC family transcriptional regulator [Clostridium sp. MF28]NRZ27722.1 AraC-like DNA-binding protein [Clostridium beijerinckii]NYB96494.1 AraC-like DNA-binding protein [Clostridium beijerinckii]OOM20428.1 virulence regulon transcriptional activator VirF [Clostridium beijerinckii]PSM56654.1 AraC family transcriptional regulator [Clostridium diolis]